MSKAQKNAAAEGQEAWQNCKDGIYSGDGFTCIIKAQHIDGKSVEEAKANAAEIVHRYNTQPELFVSCMELREAGAACFRVINRHGQAAVDDLEQELASLQIQDGFGIRAQCAIAKAAGGRAP